MPEGAIAAGAPSVHHLDQQQVAGSWASDAADAPARMRRIASAPALRAACASSAAAAPPRRACACATAAAGAQPCSCLEGGLEVYVVSRAFTEFAGPLVKKMSPEMRLSLVDLGLCHYMTVFRTPEGKYVQFDFGPHGGDVEKVNGPVGAWLRRARQQQQQQQQRQQQAGGGGMRQSPSAPALELCAALAAAEGGRGDGCCGAGDLDDCR
jgi:hypothetical protein